MRSVGVVVHLARKSRPAALVAVLEGAWGAASLSERFELTSSNEEVPTILFDLATGLRSYLSGAQADRVVIRRADQPPRPSNREGPRLRLLAEGALAAAARVDVTDVLLMNGKALAERTPAGSKASLTAQAAQDVPQVQSEAVEAALCGLAP